MKSAENLLWENLQEYTKSFKNKSVINNAACRYCHIYGMCDTNSPFVINAKAKKNKLKDGKKTAKIWA